MKKFLFQKFEKNQPFVINQTSRRTTGPDTMLSKLHYYLQGAVLFPLNYPEMNKRFRMIPLTIIYHFIRMGCPCSRFRAQFQPICSWQPFRVEHSKLNLSKERAIGLNSLSL